MRRWMDGRMCLYVKHIFGFQCMIINFQNVFFFFFLALANVLFWHFSPPSCHCYSPPSISFPLSLPLSMNAWWVEGGCMWACMPFFEFLMQLLCCKFDLFTYFGFVDLFFPTFLCRSLCWTIYFKGYICHFSSLSLLFFFYHRVFHNDCEEDFVFRPLWTGVALNWMVINENRFSSDCIFDLVRKTSAAFLHNNQVLFRCCCRF